MHAPPRTNRYSVIYARQAGRWLHGRIRDEPEKDIPAHDRLDELEWLLGEWVNESDDNVVFTTCKRSDDGNYLVREFDVKVEGRIALRGTQCIGWDPKQGQFRTWVFDDSGGFADGLISATATAGSSRVGRPLRRAVRHVHHRDDAPGKGPAAPGDPRTDVGGEPSPKPSHSTWSGGPRTPGSDLQGNRDPPARDPGTPSRRRAMTPRIGRWLLVLTLAFAFVPWHWLTNAVEAAVAAAGAGRLPAAGVDSRRRDAAEEEVAAEGRPGGGFSHSPRQQPPAGPAAVAPRRGKRAPLATPRRAEPRQATGGRQRRRALSHGKNTVDHAPLL